VEIGNKAAEPVRGTQSFVHILSACWRRPSLTALEVAWRWGFGAPAAALIGYEGLRIVRETRVDVGALGQMSLLDPTGSAATLAQMSAALMPPVLRTAEWLGPLLLTVWVVVSSFGRGMVLRRVDPRLHARPGVLMVLQAARLAALAASFALWFLCLRAGGRIAINDPLAAGQEPNLLLYFSLAIIATLGLFTLWAAASWALSVAPLLAMLHNLGVRASLATALRLAPVRSKLIEINLIMGIVRIMLVVLAIAFSACPLPFESVATPGFMAWWYSFVTVLYLIAADLFHVVQQVYYLEMWRAYDRGDPGVGAST
jgi:hypothetical protein